ncbi:MAG TPA: xanthine dehydrogenase family protein molybdopterin-binding subunit [Dehalococcoidia bacterium]|nr:xanthine dehydrogenase family protein molybdopterin-binding subunit [Dehalococcoidia bacterium]
MVTEAKRAYKVIGTRPLRPDGIDKVTGRALYGADIHIPGALHARMKRSPHAHAVIKRIDASRALAMDGVKAVVTAVDLAPGGDLSKLADPAQNILAGHKALYRGQAVAAVAAINDQVAQEAVKLIDIEYEVLPHVLGPREGMQSDAPILHEALRTRGPGAVDGPTNIVAINQAAFGDVDKAFADCDIVVDDEFSTKMVHQGYIEPQAATATWAPDGQLTIWTTTQGSFPARESCAQLLNHPISKIKVIPTEIGGGFGGKISVYLEPVVALLSRKTGKPVTMRMDRSDVFEGTGPTPGTSIKARLGATKDGRIRALYADMAYENGAFPGSASITGTMVAAAAYDIEHVKVIGYDVVVNKPRTQDYRAPSAPAAAFAIEQLIDELALKLEMDPLQLRLLNAAKEGTRGPMGMPYKRIGHEECLRAALDSEHYRSPLGGPNRGRGVASGFWFNVGLRSSVNVSLQPDGTVNLIEGNTDIGGTRASLAMQLAETLGIPYEDVKPTVVDTDSVGLSDVTAGSRTTFGTGMAVHEAGKNLIKEMTARLAPLWQTTPEEIGFDDGAFRTKDGAKSGAFKEIAAQLAGRGVALTVSGSLNAGFLAGGGFAHAVVDVEVDPDTGKVTILRYTAIQDAGTAVHPSYVEGQMQGGAVQGVGWALNEEYYYDESGRMANASFLDYRLPTSLDVPMIDTIIVEVPNPLHPFGVRGVGEPGIVPPLAAIANAVTHATGVRQTQLPMSPRRILETTRGIV